MSISDKTRLRRSLLQKRVSLSAEIWRIKSDRLGKQLQSLPIYINAKTILAYFSFRQEPDLSPLFTNSNNQYRWGFPRCVGNTLSWHLWHPQEKLAKNQFGILEPLSTAPTVSAQDVDLILVPGVACDRQGYRLGYGGGFYDRMLSSLLWENIPTVGVTFDFAYLPILPVEPWDIKLQHICTEKGIYSSQNKT